MAHIMKNRLFEGSVFLWVIGRSLTEPEIGILPAQDANTLDFLRGSGALLRRSPSLIPQK